MGDKPAVLVTRPAGQAAGLCSGFEQLGYRAYSLPMLELVAAAGPNEQQKLYLSALDRYQHIIFISGNAVHFGMAWIESCWPTLPVGPAWYAIGEVTAQRLRDYGVRALSPGAVMTTESLLEAPALCRAVVGQRVLIVKGYGGRVSLREALVARGAVVDELCCYQRRCPVMTPGGLYSALAKWHIGLILVSSGEGLSNMLTLLSPEESTKLKRIPLITPSGRVTSLAQDMGFAAVTTAANASDKAMLRAAQDRWQKVSGSGE